MRTLNLKEAAAFLHVSPAALRQKACSGQIHGAKPGKRWVFLEEDLVAFLRSLYPQPRQAPQSGCKEVTLCHSTNAATRGGFASQPPTESRYADLLGLPVARKRRSSMTD